MGGDLTLSNGWVENTGSVHTQPKARFPKALAQSQDHGFPWRDSSPFGIRCTETSTQSGAGVSLLGAWASQHNRHLSSKGDTQMDERARTSKGTFRQSAPHTHPSQAHISHIHT